MTELELDECTEKKLDKKAHNSKVLTVVEKVLVTRLCLTFVTPWTVACQAPKVVHLGNGKWVIFIFLFAYTHLVIFHNEYAEINDKSYKNYVKEYAMYCSQCVL